MHTRPTPYDVVMSQLVELLLNQKQEDTAQPQFSGIDMLEYLELRTKSPSRRWGSHSRLVR